mmetsp:Transcript_15482/g.46484  ORF Transcript_15482/g.46484 Transcript_15482/m.46484 type:complete len:291 (+) Transcript_15482:691-1563(+)
MMALPPCRRFSGPTKVSFRASMVLIASSARVTSWIRLWPMASSLPAIGEILVTIAQGASCRFVIPRVVDSSPAATVSKLSHVELVSRSSAPRMDASAKATPTLFSRFTRIDSAYGTAAPRTVRRWLLSKSRSCIAKKTIEMKRPTSTMHALTALCTLYFRTTFPGLARPIWTTARRTSDARALLGDFESACASLVSDSPDFCRALSASVNSQLSLMLMPDMVAPWELVLTMAMAGRERACAGEGEEARRSLVDSYFDVEVNKLGDLPSEGISLPLQRVYCQAGPTQRRAG